MTYKLTYCLEYQSYFPEGHIDLEGMGSGPIHEG